MTRTRNKIMPNGKVILATVTGLQFQITIPGIESHQVWFWHYLAWFSAYATHIMARTKEGTVPFDMYRQLENPITFKDQDYDEDGNKIEVDVPTYLIMAFRPGHPVYVAKDGWTMDLQVHVVQSGPAAECPELTTTDWYQVLAGETPGSPYHFNRFYPVHLHCADPPSPPPPSPPPPSPPPPPSVPPFPPSASEHPMEHSTRSHPKLFLEHLLEAALKQRTFKWTGGVD